MLRYAIICLVVALIAAALGFGGVSGIAMYAFYVFIIPVSYTHLTLPTNREV